MSFEMTLLKHLKLVGFLLEPNRKKILSHFLPKVIQSNLVISVRYMLLMCVLCVTIFFSHQRVLIEFIERERKHLCLYIMTLPILFFLSFYPKGISNSFARLIRSHNQE